MMCQPLDAGWFYPWQCPLLAIATFLFQAVVFYRVRHESTRCSLKFPAIMPRAEDVIFVVPFVVSYVRFLPGVLIFSVRRLGVVQ